MEINSLIKDIKEKHDNYENKISDLKSKIARLTQQGTSSGKFYIRKEKSKKTGDTIKTYYILYPMKNGKRRKEYIGRELQRIEEARKRIERYQKREELKSSLFLYEFEISKIMNSLRELVGS